MNERFTAAIIGLGQIGMGYDLAKSTAVLSHARALSLHQNFDLIAAIDPCESKRSIFKQHYSLPAYTSLKQMQQESRTSPDLIIIATSTEYHLEILREVLKRFTPLLVICEKPFTLNKAQAQHAIELCHAANCKLLINYMRRCEPGTKQCAELIQSERIGVIEKAVVWYSKGLKHNGSHFIDLLHHWLGDINSTKIIRAEKLGNGDTASDILMQFYQTPVYFLSRNEQNYSYYSIELDGTKGRLKYDNGGMSISWRGVEEDPNFPDYRRLSDSFTNIPNDMLRYQLHAVNDWYDCLSGKPFSSCQADEGLLIHRITDIISAQTDSMIEEKI